MKIPWIPVHVLLESSLEKIIDQALQVHRIKAGRRISKLLKANAQLIGSIERMIEKHGIHI